MRLSKEVCRRCVEERGHLWLPVDEARWHQGRVFCGVIVGAGKVYIDKAPPEWCKYVAEHMVSQ